MLFFFWLFIAKMGIFLVNVIRIQLHIFQLHIIYILYVANPNGQIYCFDYIKKRRCKLIGVNFKTKNSPFVIVVFLNLSQSRDNGQIAYFQQVNSYNIRITKLFPLQSSYFFLHLLLFNLHQFQNKKGKISSR